MEKVFEIIKETLHLRDVEVTEDSSFRDDFGADSIDLVEMVMALEEEYGLEIAYEEVVDNVKTVGEAIEYLRTLGVDL